MTDAPEDVEELAALVDALRRRTEFLRERVDDLEDEKESLRGRVTELERVVDPDTAGTEYERMTKPERVYQLRVALTRGAMDNGGKWSMDYNAVQALFDNYPSPSYCYELMSCAGNMDGFDLDEPSGRGGNKRIRVNLDAVKDETLFHAAKKDDRDVDTEGVA